MSEDEKKKRKMEEDVDYMREECEKMKDDEKVNDV